MKCIAVVTMFFLPGTFVSSLLSMPLFDFEARNTSAMYRASYWKAKTRRFPCLDLSADVLDLWNLGFLESCTSRQTERSVSSAKAQLVQGSFEDETRVLSFKKRSLTGTVTGNS